MSQLAGEWVYGDAGSKLEWAVTQDGEPFDVTGAGTIVLHMVRPTSGGDVTDTITGAIQAPASAGIFEFSAIGTSVASPAVRSLPDVYECRVSFVISATTYWTEAALIKIVKFP